ncbi:hypothetical protein SKAU_G00306840 [Synaphobranchus kaupii]|uniref:GBD/FH3 domain-containing protein n=1 Tax=Synaphobranchus kaupii TaxID=118154 RepID=A0A9Q1EQY9_SYNKA|nr:hypothetical protein SKAU_G00306840 [Synaphobranchus kaupii]
MATVTCRVQYLEDTDPFVCTNFPEPRRPPPHNFYENIALSEQIAGVHKLLEAPLKLEECALQLAPNGNYLDLELSLVEQKDDLDHFYEDIGKGKKPILILRTQLSVRVHSILEKLYNSHGPELRRSLFSLKQLFQDDKDLVPEFVNSEGLTCFIKVGSEADHNYQNYILRALSQIMLFVDGMNGVINHSETVQWLYTLSGSLSRLVVKTALKLLIVFVEYTETNGLLLLQAINTVDGKRGALRNRMMNATQLQAHLREVRGTQVSRVNPWAYLTEILEERNGSDTELLVYTMSLINKTLAALPDQDSFYDVTDCLEKQGMERIMQKRMNNKGTEADLKQQLAIYENALKHEDGELEGPSPHIRKERRKGRVEHGGGEEEPEVVWAKPSRSTFTSCYSDSGSPVSSTILSPVSSDGIAVSPTDQEQGLSASSPSPTDSAPPENQSQPLSEQQQEQEQEQEQQQQERPEGRSIFNPEMCDVNMTKPVLRRFAGKFLRSLAATQLEKKRRSLHSRPSEDREPEEEWLSPDPNVCSPPDNGSGSAFPSWNTTPSGPEPHVQEANRQETSPSPSTLEQPGDRRTAQNEAGGGVQRQGSMAEQRKTLSDDRKFMMDMIYSNNTADMLQSPGEEESPAGEGAQGRDAVPYEGQGVADRLSSLQTRPPPGEDASRRAELEGLGGIAQATRARLEEEQKSRRIRPQYSIDAEDPLPQPGDDPHDPAEQGQQPGFLGPAAAQLQSAQDQRPGLL